MYIQFGTILAVLVDWCQNMSYFVKLGFYRAPQTARAFGQNNHPMFTPFGREYVLTQKRYLRDLQDGQVPSNLPFRCRNQWPQKWESYIVLELNIVLMSDHPHTPHITLMESYTLLEIWLYTRSLAFGLMPLTLSISWHIICYIYDTWIYYEAFRLHID